MIRRSRRHLVALFILPLLLSGLPVASLPGATAAVPRAKIEPVTSHPRLWITADDLPRLRSWATDANPFWRDGLAVLAEEARSEMDAGTVPGEDSGDDAWEEYPTEGYAEYFAFLSLVHPDEAARQDYAQRARTLLMHVMSEAVKGPAEGEPFRVPGFAAYDNDRARWWGEAWALTVDWIYPILTVEDKATIRQVFLRWSHELVTTGYHRPGYYDESLVGVVNDPVLLADRSAVHWAGNNYFTAHMRNLGLMAMAFDPADDPGGELGAYLQVAIGAHLYMVDELLRTDAAGGLAPEGFEYSPQAIGYVIQFLLALHTAGQDDAARWGPRVRFDSIPFWDEVVPAFLHSIAPAPVVLPGEEWRGPVYQPAWYGDGQTYWVPDMIELFGPLGRYDDLAGNGERLAAIRWIQTHTPPGGAEALIPKRVADTETHHDAILYFLLFDPAAPAPADPRPGQPLFHLAPGVGRFLARTSWNADATWFTFALGWQGVDHRHGDGNQFELYRNGEWLTKGLVGYGSSFDDGDPTDDYVFPSSEYHNTLALENDPPQYNSPGDHTHQHWLRGSQWPIDPAGAPTILAMSVAPGYAYALGDATNLYNSIYEQTTDILHASRSIVWLAPDAIVIYDRAASETDGRFKRFWLNLPADGTVDGTRTTMTTASGQQLVIDTLLPAGVAPSVQPLDIREEDMASGEPMRYRLLVEAPGRPREARFFHVLQAADEGTTAAPVGAFESTDGTFAGTVVGTTAVLFPVEVGAEVGEVSYTVPGETTTHLLTGLTPGGGYDVTTTPGANGLEVVVAAGSAYRADEGGVLLVGSLPEAIPGAALAFTNAPAPLPAVTTPEPEDDEAEGGTGTPEPAAMATPPAPTVPAVTEGGAVAEGTGQIVYNVFDGDLFRIAARVGATPENISQALAALAPTTDPSPVTSPSASPVAEPVVLDAWVGTAADGGWLVIGTERLHPDCAGWACLVIMPADLSSAEVVTIDGQVIHPEGPAAIAGGGNLVVYADDGGPHELDLWAITRAGENWNAPVLLTGASPYANHVDPAISADGTRIVFECADQPYGADGTALCEVGSDGTGFRVALAPADVPAGATAALRQPAYAPDGSIVFEASWDSTIWRLPVGTAMPEPVGAGYYNDATPCVLPDDRVASLWSDRPDGGGMHELKVMTADGTSYAMLVTGMDIEDIDCAA
jgi:hypothetical protein